MQLEGKNIVMTGASGGIGLPLAQHLLNKGAQLTVIGRTNPLLPAATWLQGDLSSMEGLKVAEALRNRKVDMLINLAGIQYFGPLENQTPEHIAQTYQINLLAPVLLTQAVLPQMKQRGSGHIVNIGSTFGSIPFAHFATYSSAKSGLKGFTEALRREVADTGIHVTYIAPRAVDTTMNNALVRKFGELTHMNVDTPQNVASCIFDAIIHQKDDVYIGFPEKLFVRLNALLPRLVDRALRKNDRLAARLFHPSGE